MKRTFWAATGFTLGFSSSLYLQRRLRRLTRRFVPDKMRRNITAVGKKVGAQTQGLVADLREAAHEGSSTMRQTEQDLHNELVSGSTADSVFTANLSDRLGLLWMPISFVTHLLRFLRIGDTATNVQRV